MAKFKIMDKEKTHTVTLRQHANGTVTLEVGEYNILTITNEGKLMLIKYIPDDIGLSLDADGYVVTYRDTD